MKWLTWKLDNNRNWAPIHQMYSITQHGTFSDGFAYGQNWPSSSCSLKTWSMPDEPGNTLTQYRLCADTPNLPGGCNVAWSWMALHMGKIGLYHHAHLGNNYCKMKSVDSSNLHCKCNVICSGMVLPLGQFNINSILVKDITCARWAGWHYTSIGIEHRFTQIAG